jgi:nucleoid-associated protein YgaU
MVSGGLGSYLKTFLVCLVLLALASGARWLLLSQDGLRALDQDLVTYRFRPQVEKQSEWTPPALASVKIDEPHIETSSVEVLVEEILSPTNHTPSPSAKNSRMFAASRVIQVKTTDHTKYVVEAGDHLDKISKKFYGTYQRYKEILKANPGLDPKGLRPGMVIKIPEAPKGLPVNTLSYVSEPKTSMGFHVIRSGDTLGAIAQQKLGSTKWVSKILGLNPGLNPSRLRVGQKIKLPEVTQASR